MYLRDYETEIVRYADPNDFGSELVPMLGLGGHVGELLLAQQRYLGDSLVAETSRGIVGRELGLVLRWSALLAHMNGIRFEDVALDNLRKVNDRAKSLGEPGLADSPNDADLSLGEYQRLAAQTDQEIRAGADPLSLSVPMLGLAGEAGNLLVEMKKRFRGDSAVPSWIGLVSEELGDLLWYAATVARHIGLDLERVAEDDLQSLVRSAPVDPTGQSPSGNFDSVYPETERFPRQIHLQFQERVEGAKPTVVMTLHHAVPNAFPSGPISRGNHKYQGFEIGKPLGDEVNDNSRRADAYRFHDAIHLGFLAVLGWSPNLRNILQLKRKSDPVVDEAEDGARAVFAEEGLAAILAKQAPAGRNFEAPSLVPEELLDLITTVVEDLEVGGLPYRMWRSAISQGFGVMRQLTEAGGGYVLADLDQRTLKYSKFPLAISAP